MDFVLKSFTCLHSLRNNVYNCIIFLKFYMVKRALKREHSHCIGFLWIAVLCYWMNASETTMEFTVKAHL